MRQAPYRYTLAFALILLGALGILLSPSVGVSAGKYPERYEHREVRESPLEAGLVVDDRSFSLTFVETSRGLGYMTAGIFMSLGSIFAGVHWMATLARRPILS